MSDEIKVGSWVYWTVEGEADVLCEVKAVDGDRVQVQPWAGHAVSATEVEIGAGMPRWVDRSALRLTHDGPEHR